MGNEEQAEFEQLRVFTLMLHRVSVVIPTVNRADLLVQAVESVLRQTYSNIEIIVVDDGSTDGTLFTLLQFGVRVRYVFQRNRGMSAARNTGLLRTSGEFVVFLDSDDVLLPTKIESQVAFLVDHPIIDVVYGDGYTMDEDGRLGPLEPFVVRFPPSNREEFGALLLNQNMFAVHAATVRKSILPPTLPFDESLRANEDWDLWLRLWLAGSTFAYQDEKVAIYRRHAGNMGSADQRIFVEPARRITFKIIGQRLDRALSPRVRQQYRLDRLDYIALHAPAHVSARACADIVLPGRGLSAWGVSQLLLSLVRSGTPNRRWYIPGPIVVALLLAPYPLRRYVRQAKHRCSAAAAKTRRIASRWR